MNECPCGIEFEIGDSPGVEFTLGDSGAAEFSPGDPVINTGTKDYERLINKPAINGREIIGDKTVAYYLQDGLILDGGDAQEVS